MLLLLLLVELRRSSALCPPSCPTTVKEITTKPHDPTPIPGYATDSTNANNLECFKCDSFQSSLDECKGEQTDGTSVCQNGQWCFINVVYRDIDSRDDMLRYERGCWDEAMCDDAAKNNEENLAKESCIQQNGTYINVVYRDIDSRDDMLRYERGCWDEAMCDDAAKNNEENLAKESCIQQNGTRHESAEDGDQKMSAERARSERGVCNGFWTSRERFGRLRLEVGVVGRDSAILPWFPVLNFCEVQLTSEDWDPVTKRATTVYSLLAVRDTVNDGHQNFMLKFYSFNFFMATPNNGLWRGYQIPPILIRTVDPPKESCTSTGNALYGAVVSLGQYDIGTYAMYRSTVRPFEIHFPSGSKVDVITTTTGMDITIHVPSDDFQNCEGLCGNFDLVHSEAWK
ncbi:Hypp5398 [Branchiostoma lanceolatum]|uniref:Hypp5398 protein n=1 Tax=Branchiostoma lanceolatum TaxID=7740 RepID=A0A8K0F215_BRALA|nr:Hypp5398 [Branchiostoma lanceolatum]